MYLWARSRFTLFLLKNIKNFNSIFKGNTVVGHHNSANRGKTEIIMKYEILLFFFKAS